MRFRSEKSFALVTISIIFSIGFVLGVVFLYITYAHLIGVIGCSVEPYISPSSEFRLISLIDDAEESVYVECYLITNDQIVDAFIRARNRGIDVRVILDPSIDTNKEVFLTLIERGVEVKWSSQSFTRMHAKMVIIDRKKVFIGSSNLTHHGFNKNRETNVIISGCDLSQFITIFEHDWKIAG